MAALSSDDHGTEFNCPHCGARVRADWEQLSQAVECPECHLPFEPPTPRDEVNREAVERSFRFQCLRCGSVLEATTQQSGNRGKCPSCGGVFIIPEMDLSTGLARTNADPTAENENPVPVHAYAAAGEQAPRIVQTQNDTLFIECPRCQSQSPINADNCQRCGLPFTLEGNDFKLQSAVSTRAQWALFCGIIALPLSFWAGVGIVPGILGITLGIQSWKTELLGKLGVALGVPACIIGTWMLFKMI